MAPQNIKTLLENSHSLTTTLLIADACVKNHQLIKELFLLINRNDKILSQRAAWPIAHLAKKRPDILAAFIPQLISLLKTTNLHQAVYRNALKALSLIEISEKYTGNVFDLALGVITNEKQSIAARSYAMELALKCCLPYVELTKELELIITSLINHKSAAIRSKSKQLSKDIKKARW
jgi:hypothetical protein